MSLVQILSEDRTDRCGRKKIKRMFVVKCDYCGKNQRPRNYVKEQAEREHHFCNAFCARKYEHQNKKQRIFKIYFCPFCDEVIFKLKNIFAKHLANKHDQDINNCTFKIIDIDCDLNKTNDELYVEYVLGGVWPRCACGCGEQLQHPRYGQKYSYGHVDRVHNNWGHNPEALQKSLETRRQMSANGELTGWCKGLTTDTDIRLREYGQKIRRHWENHPEKREQYAQRLRQMRQDGLIRPQHGAEHPRWKGGKSPIQAMARADHKLYIEWKFPILCRDKFKCTVCGKSPVYADPMSKLQVHHSSLSFSEIIDIVLRENNLTIDPDNFDNKRMIADLVVAYHINHQIPGHTICRRCHGKLHPSLNFK